MAERQGLKFKISAALKNLIGKELITDEFIAVFELVKNSFDAHARNVTIIFEDIYEDNSKLIIKDNGKGMNYTDLIEKWLFVAYSAKKEGVEDSLPGGKADYRDKIYSKRVFAGAKGVGRFSCDRLGEKLRLITIKDEEQAKIECLEIEWKDFEKDAKEEFVNINVEHKTLKSHGYGIKHGTILEITGLSDNWGRDRILKLKHSLEKLINPNQENDSHNFSIAMEVPDEKYHDAEEDDERNIVNGPIKNFLFETLELKTTQIKTEIIEDGCFIRTTLMDRGTLIYRIKEKNIFHNLRSNIVIHLFQLNRSAKISFKKKMGIDSVIYGSVFLYKNGFRVYPFGEEGEDILGIDRRKQQGFARYLGTRDLIGRIEINDIDNIDNLNETTSRDGGLIKNKNFSLLKEYFYKKALHRLEKYVVDVIKWGDQYKLDKDDKEYQPPKNPEDVKDEILEIISSLSKSGDLIDVEYDEDFLDIIASRQKDSLSKNLENLSRVAEKTNDPHLYKKAKKIERRFKELLSAKDEAEKETEAKLLELEKVEEELELTTSQNLFLKSLTTPETKELASLKHHINQGTFRIGKNLENMVLAINSKAPKEDLLRYANKISLENKKISAIAGFISKAKFDTMSLTMPKEPKDFVNFIKEYIQNVYQEDEKLSRNNQLLDVKVKAKRGLKFDLRFSPLEIIILIDNLLNNSLKAGANNVIITLKSLGPEDIQLSFLDDGKGIPKEQIDKIFDFGYTTTGGTGIGLHHVKQIVDEMKGTIVINNNHKRGVEFIVKFKK